MTAAHEHQGGRTPRHDPTGNDGAAVPATGQPDHTVLNDTAEQASTTPERAPAPPESGGRAGPDPVRYGDWEKNGRCIDF